MLNHYIVEIGLFAYYITYRTDMSKIQNSGLQEMGRSIDHLYFHWKYRWSTDLAISCDLQFCSS